MESRTLNKVGEKMDTVKKAVGITGIVTMPIDEDKVIVKRTYLEELERFADENTLTARTWTMADLEKRLAPHKRNWIKKNILIPFYDELTFENGGVMFMPSNRSQQYSFNAKGMAEFLDTHFSSIYKKVDRR